MVTPRQVRAARMLLQWDQVTLADRAVVALTALQRFEQGKTVRNGTIAAIEKALTSAGIVFVLRPNQEGVVLHRS
jgi:transcriptional regulator with XRE-family HTH domain